MTKKAIIPLALLLLIVTNCYSQITRCSTAVDYNWLQINAPERYQRFMELETFTTNYINNQGQSSNRLINGSGLIIIPVVVHVLHYGETIGTGYNISMAVIQSQIDVLNEDYRRLNADASNTPSVFQSLASDFNIEFRLACIDPNGNPSTGVVRKQTSIATVNGGLKRSDDTPDDVAIGIKTEPNGSIAWNTLQYLNIWVCNVSVDGYATYPSDNPLYQEFDGVVIDKHAFGRIGGTGVGRDKGRTATHEIGHWLNLNHIWDSNCSDDGVGDTPKQNFYHITCPPFPELTYRCDLNDPSTMFMNYLDVTDDDCLNLFTNGQKNRARALFAPGGGILTRVSHLNNWFKVRQKVNPIRCDDIIYSSPACLPTTWTILSGPATIVSGQGTNQATIQPTGVGTVLVRAVSGNYISEDTITVSNRLPSISGGTYSTNGQNLPLLIWNGGNNNYNNVCNLELTNTNMNIQDATTVTWSRISNIPNYPAPWSQNGNDLSFYLTSINQKTIFRVTASNSCGSVFLDFGFNSTDCSNSCNSFTISPNPTKGSLRVIVPNVPPPCLSASAGTVKEKSFQELSISEIRIYDNSGNLKRIQKEYKTKQSTVNISGFKPGVYIVEVSDGVYKERHRVLVKE